MAASAAAASWSGHRLLSLSMRPRWDCKIRHVLPEGGVRGGGRDHGAYPEAKIGGGVTFTKKEKGHPDFKSE